MKLYINGIYKVVYARRLVARAFIPNSENKLYVNHINGIRHDNRADNLEWVSLKEKVITEQKIQECCSRKRNFAGKWQWMYYEDYILIQRSQ